MKSKPPIKKRNSKQTKYKTYTRDDVIAILEKMITELMLDDEIYTEAGIRAKYKVGNRAFANWKHVIYYDDGEIMERFDLIDTILQYRLEDGGLKNKVNPYFAKFLLVSKYKYVETSRTEIDANVEHSGAMNINVTIEGSNEDVNI